VSPPYEVEALCNDDRCFSVRIPLCPSACLSRAWTLVENGRVRNLKIHKSEAHYTVDPWPHSEIKGQCSRSLGRLMSWQKIRHIFGTGRPKNFKLGRPSEYDDAPHRRARWPQRLMVKVITTCHLFYACLSITRQRRVAEVSKSAGSLSASRWHCTVHQVEGQRSKWQERSHWRGWPVTPFLFDRFLCSLRSSCC